MTSEESQTPVEELCRTIRVLEQVVGDRGILLSLSKEDQERFLKAAGQVAHPGRAARRQLVRADRNRRKQKLQELKQADEQLLQKTGIRSERETKRLANSCPPAPALQPPLAVGENAAGEHATTLDDNAPQAASTIHSPEANHNGSSTIGQTQLARNCYICKQDFHQIHSFYDSLCPACAEFNWEKRNQTADLQGRHAVITGGRVKIGFEAALKLLRAGATLVVTTRFPCDATKRFNALHDSSDWIDQLHIFGLDLRHTPSIEAFANHLARTFPKLDFILNNACQTVRRPPKFYAHLMQAERELAGTFAEDSLRPLALYQELIRKKAIAKPESANSLISTPESNLPSVTGSLVGILQAAELSQLALTEEDVGNAQAFPLGALDEDAQQVDLRDRNSWRLKAAEVSTIELLEVQLVNSIAPFLLNARLKPLMLRTEARDKHIVNVSAMEGVFYRAFKTDAHPHTNMAKAALNMLTRTSAADYVRDGIHMNSVDTGWITDEDPIEITQRKNAERGFTTPLDSTDAAARICDPIFAGLNTGEHQWGKFLKDYRVSNW